MKTRVLLTGHNGFIGKNMASWLAHNGYVVDGFDTSESILPQVRSYEWVIHLGLMPDEHESSIDQLLTQNFDFNQRLFNECQQHGVHLQYASSSSVYGLSKDLSEYADCHPQTPYAWSKYLFDRWVFQQPHTALVQGFRYFDVYGKWMHLNKSPYNFIYQWREQARNSGVIKVWANAEHAKRDWTWVGDICKLHTDFMERVVGSGIWNVGSGLSHKLIDIAETIAQQEGATVELIPTPATETVQWRQCSCAELTKLKSTIGRRQWLNIYEWLELESSSGAS